MATETNIHREARLAKLKTLQERGYNPYPYSFHPTAYAADLQENIKIWKPAPIRKTGLQSPDAPWPYATTVCL